MGFLLIIIEFDCSISQETVKWDFIPPFLTKNKIKIKPTKRQNTS